MNMLSLIADSLADFYNLDQSGDSVIINTHCMYPSNSLVRVAVRGTDNACVVSDEWGAHNEIKDVGGDNSRLERAIASQAKKYGLVVDRGNIHTQVVHISNVAGAVALVANASKEIARHLFAVIKPERPEFKVTLRNMLHDKFNGAVKHDMKLVGFSNKTHSFENVIIFGDSRFLIVDPVTVDHTSINNRLVANLDIQRKQMSDIQQRIVYDDSDEWNRSDLSLLTIGAPVVGFSKAFNTIEQIMDARN